MQLARTQALADPLIVLGTCGSTNAELRSRIEVGERLGHPAVLLTDAQTAGRGRLDRTWSAPAGSALAVSTLLRDLPSEIDTWGWIPLAAGVAMTDAVAAQLPGHAVGLKWPNDVLVDGAKLSGILLETEQRADLSRFLVIGIGVNTTQAPQGLPYPATSLAALGHHVSAETLFRELSAEWVGLMDLWQGGRGFPAIRRLWLERAAGLEGEILVQTGRENLRGTFETLDDTGQLVVRLGDGSSRLVTAGDVHFGHAATGRAAARTDVGEAGVVA